MKGFWIKFLIFLLTTGLVNLAFIKFWRFDLLTFVIAPIISVVVLLLIQSIRDRMRGFTTSISGEYSSELKYTEYGVGTLQLFAEMAEGLYVHVPSDSEWKSKMPSWAKERRTEIMNRIIEEYSWDKGIHFENYKAD